MGNPNPVNRYSPSPHKEEAKQALRNGTSVEEVATRFGLSERAIWRYLKEVRNEPGFVASPDQTRSQPAVSPTKAAAPKKGGVGGGQYQEGGKIATVTAPKPAAINFYLGSDTIELDAGALLESYLLYADIQRQLSITQSFSSFLRDGAGLIWSVLLGGPVIEKGEVKKEVNHG